MCSTFLQVAHALQIMQSGYYESASPFSRKFKRYFGQSHAEMMREVHAV
jgi:AraC-like DNA-binding protein